MIQEKRGMLKVWNVSLVLATGVLAVLGTFLVRSGILDSIHAFGASTLGVPFVVFIGLLVCTSIGLVVWRRDMLRSEHRLDSLFSSEAAFLLNNVVLVGLCFVVFWGTFFPLISEAVTGNKASVGPPWFDRYTVPLALILVLLSGIGPVIAWRRATPANLRRNFVATTVVAAAVAVLLVPIGGWDSPLSALMFSFAGFVFGAVGQELVRGVRARRAMAGEAPATAASASVQTHAEMIAARRRRWRATATSTITASAAMRKPSQAASPTTASKPWWAFLKRSMPLTKNPAIAIARAIGMARTTVSFTETPSVRGCGASPHAHSREP